MSEPRRWSVVVIYAIAMALLEAAVVTYLRTLIGRIDPYQTSPLPVPEHLMRIELAREAATLAMLGAVAWLAGRERRSRLGYFLVAFGVWDIFYYAFLVPMTGWPRSPLDWDVLFLIPLPWWGPVLSPVLIALLLVIGGTLVSQFDRPDRPIWPGRTAWALNLGGVALALYVFMTDALHAAPQGADAVRTTLPVHFNWLLFGAALVLLAAPILEVSGKIHRLSRQQLSASVLTSAK
jgi:hypothetical protein